jgi:hypothetical protein
MRAFGDQGGESDEDTIGVRPISLPPYSCNTVQWPSLQAVQTSATNFPVLSALHGCRPCLHRPSRAHRWDVESADLESQARANGPMSIKKLHFDRVAPVEYTSFDPRQAPSEKTSAPVDCPFCTSTHVVTAADVKGKATVKDADRYWRCAACGEVWNPARSRGPS